MPLARKLDSLPNFISEDPIEMPTPVKEEASVEEMPKPQRPWIPLTLQDFHDEFGYGITNLLAGTILQRHKSGDLEAVLFDDFGNPIKEAEPSEIEDKKFEWTEVQRRFSAKVFRLGGVIRTSILNGLQGNEEQLEEVDPASPDLQKMLLDLIAADFLSELKGSELELKDIEVRAQEIREKLKAWDKGSKPVRLPSRKGGWVSSHRKSVSVL